ncbi:ABC transporter ATP-binding protein [Demequina sp.]|uniref:ABC transporter ATP-binding protein n=1 Tax=Demequina sp. TaxID=2050685 RepID=UPI0025C49C4A|nr:ABC transporter ATP-binding protein [Demequina sp.]
MSELQIRKIVAGYDSAPVLRGVSFTVPHGSLTAVLGPSGSGKSTLLRVIAGLNRPVEGAVVVGGRVLSGPRVHVAPERRRIGLVPQDAALFPHLDVLANVGFGLPRAQRRATRALDLLDMVGMGAFATRMPGELSGGQRHRVALARALATEPDVVLLDEPFSALDAALRAEVRGQVRQVLRRAHTTAVLVTHDQDEALSMADQVAVVDEGRLVQVGTPAEIYAKPASRWLAQFIGGALVLPGTWNDGTVVGPLGTVPAVLADGHLANRGDTVDLVLRPEQLSLRTVGSGGEGVVAMVRDVAYFGHDAVVTMDLPACEQPLQARVLGDQQWRPDSEVLVSVRSAGLAFARQ